MQHDIIDKGEARRQPNVTRPMNQTGFCNQKPDREAFPRQIFANTTPARRFSRSPTAPERSAP
jgi:hypothetical protein